MPHLLGSGLLFGNLFSFICLSAGIALEPASLTDVDTHQMRACLEAIHSRHVSHGDVSFSNFVRGHDEQIWLIDFDHSQIVAEEDAGLIRDQLDLEQLLTRVSLIS